MNEQKTTTGRKFIKTKNTIKQTTCYNSISLMYFVTIRYERVMKMKVLKSKSCTSNVSISFLEGICTSG